MPSKKPTSDAAQPSVASRLIDRIMDNLDIDGIASSLADQLGQKLLATVSTDSLVNVLFDKYHEEFHQTFTQALLDKL